MGAITWRKAGAYVLVILPVLGLAAIAVMAQQQSQDTSQQPAEDPVADAARKAREQKKQAPKPKKVYTNDDVSRASAPAATAPKPDDSAKHAPSDANPDTAAEVAKSDKDADKNSEAAWRKRFKEVRQKLAEAEKELDILQREANKNLTQFYSDPQKALTEQYTRKDINEHDTKIAAKKEEIAQLKQNISDLEDALRKSGGDIGWSRE